MIVIKEKVDIQPQFELCNATHTVAQQEPLLVGYMCSHLDTGLVLTNQDFKFDQGSKQYVYLKFVMIQIIS